MRERERESARRFGEGQPPRRVSWRGPGRRREDVGRSTRRLRHTDPLGPHPASQTTQSPGFTAPIIGPRVQAHLFWVRSFMQAPGSRLRLSLSRGLSPPAPRRPSRSAGVSPPLLVRPSRRMLLGLKKQPAWQTIFPFRGVVLYPRGVWSHQRIN